MDLNRLDIRLALSNADRAIARLDGMARQIENPERLFSSYLRNEAVLSSAIEGTNTSVADLALFEASTISQSKDDISVSNYVKAFDYGRDRVEDIAVGRQLFFELHQILMAGDDPEKVQPGLLRNCIVYIGQPSFSAARFVPPPDYFVSDLFDNLQTYLNELDEVPLIKLAIAHYQFEAIHPFRDGNGRLGRLMISLWLHREKILTVPMLYLSAYFERNRQEYYDRLLQVSTHGAWEDWVLFFLRGVDEQSQDACRLTAELVELREEYRRRLQVFPRVPHGVLRLLDRLFEIPVISVPQAMAYLKITSKPARASVQKLISVGILAEKPVRLGPTKYYVARELIHKTHA